MKLKSTMNKLPLITLLALGLVCSPLVVNASDGDRGRHGHNQQDRGDLHQKIDHHRSYRDYGHHKNYGRKNSCRMDYKHGNKSKHKKYGYQKSHRKDYKHSDKSGHRNDRQHGDYYNVQRHYRDGHHSARSLYLYSLLSD
jgi:hypothetical protein